MEPPVSTLKPSLLEELFLLRREEVIEKVRSVFDRTLKELCIRTRYPKEVAGFIAACLAQRGELNTGVGLACAFVRDKTSWYSLCSAGSTPCQILIAEPELDFDSNRSELLPLARHCGHAVIFSAANPRPDTPEVVTLNEPARFEVRELLKKHAFPAAKAEQLATQSNGNIHILTRLLNGTNDRPEWATGDLGYHLRCLSLVGGWDDDAEQDRLVLTEIAGEPYETWIGRIHLVTSRVEPPVLLDGNLFRPVSRYETWQQLSHLLTNGDLRRFQSAAAKVLESIAPELETEAPGLHVANREEARQTYSSTLRKNIAESLALLGSQGNTLRCSPNLGRDVADNLVLHLFRDTGWERWASLSYLLPSIAEAAPTVFLSAVEEALADLEKSPLREIFSRCDDAIFGRNHHCGLLWALEVLAWSPEYLSRVSVLLARLALFPLPQNAGNSASATLRSIFLMWLPQTLANVEARRAAVVSVLQEDLEVGWKLLLDILPEGLQTGSYNPKPAWRDWFPSDWSDGSTRSEINKQTIGYAELAVQHAMREPQKLTELISRWDHLPREVFQKVLDHLESPAALMLPASERFILWEKLVSEVDRHRKYSGSDWAMPEGELSRLETAAIAIKPSDPAIAHQLLFNAHDHHFYKTDNYDEEEKAVAKRREEAVAEILDLYGPPRILELAIKVRHPDELGNALGRIGTEELDKFLLPVYLDDSERALIALVRGYVWGRYIKTSIAWVNSLDITTWTSSQRGIFLSYLPFVADVWRFAEEHISSDISQYWSRIRPNPFQAKGDILEAAEKSLLNKRPEIAIDCINALKHEGRSVPTRLAVNAVRELFTDAGAVKRFDRFHLLEVIKYLQAAPDVDVGDMTWIEFQSLQLLDRSSGGRPVFLERRMATEPKFFHDVISACFRSESDRDNPSEVDEKTKAVAGQTYHLLQNWHMPPGTLVTEAMDELAFTAWIEATRVFCEESGHWPIAQQMIGKSLVYHPAGLDGIIKHPVVARCLNAAEHEHMRRGFTTELFNIRGVYTVSGGKEELELARNYRAYADNYDLASLARIATSLRGLAEGYDRDAEREAKRDLYAH